MVPIRAADGVSLAGSQRSMGSGNRGNQDMSQNASMGCTMPEMDPNKCIWTKLTEDIEKIATYLAAEGTPAHVGLRFMMHPKYSWGAACGHPAIKYRDRKSTRLNSSHLGNSYS